MSNELDLLAAARPDSLLSTDEVVTPAERRALLQRITAEPATASRRAPGALRKGPRRPRRLRWPVAAGLAVAAVAAALVAGLALPAGSPGGPDPVAAATLRHLADVAAGSDGPVVGPGQFAFTETSFDGEVVREWLAPNGDYWKLLVTGSRAGAPAGTCVFHWQDEPPPPGITGEYRRDPQYPSFSTAPQSVMSALPTDPQELRDYLRTHASGGQGVDQRIQKAGYTVLRNGLTPPAVRAAVLRMLALDVSHVTIETGVSDALGRPATRATFAHDEFAADEPGGSPVRQNPGGVAMAMYFDPATSQLLQAEGVFRGAVEPGSVYTTAVVDAVPDSVLACIAANPPFPGTK